MLCDICKSKEAKVHLTQIIDGKMKKVDLCEECAKEKEVTDPSAFSLTELLVGLGAGGEVATAPGNVTRCPECGFTQADFKKTQRLGCSSCYDTFSPALEPLLKAMHKGMQHVGKIPTHAHRLLELAGKIKNLEAALRQAVQEERYEEAAQIRDQIRQLEAENQPTT